MAHRDDSPPADKPPASPAEPVEVVDGIPDRAARRPLWKYLLLTALFALWLIVLWLLYWLGQP